MNNGRLSEGELALSEPVTVDELKRRRTAVLAPRAHILKVLDELRGSPNIGQAQKAAEAALRMVDIELGQIDDALGGAVAARLEYVRRCRYCRERITMKKVGEGFRPFNANGQPHTCKADAYAWRPAR